ncbi:hypothetical protein CHS0354_012238 [Potamilus streckersoni]|uniref:ZU5 domain-containing protein n=1 Tax=Potamilus streckersoni TaxID=2493646 RepID=A0AAE0SAS7_9BIVA|nr:hypothetical protein CHS0354_012238 [Potamilus streckersoni]
MMWYTLYVVVLLFIPTASSQPKSPEEQIKEEFSVQGGQTICVHCRMEERNGSAENSSVERDNIDKNARVRWRKRSHLSDHLKDCDWFTQYKKCSRLQRKLVKLQSQLKSKLENQQKYKLKTVCGTIDTRSSICCIDRLYTRRYGESTSCCGKYIYDSSREMCCQDISTDKHNTDCRKIDSACYLYKHGIIRPHFDVRSSICCEGVIYNFSDVGRDVMCCGNAIHRGNTDCFNFQSTKGHSIRRRSTRSINSTENSVPSINDFKEKSETERGINLFIFATFSVIAISVIIAAVVVFVFLYKRKASLRPKSAGNRNLDTNESGGMTSKDPSFDSMAEEKITLIEYKNGLRNCAIFSEIQSKGYVSDYLNGDVIEASTGCLDDSQTLNYEHDSTSSHCMEDESNGHSKIKIPSILSEDGPQEIVDNQKEMLNMFGDECTSYSAFGASRIELNGQIMNNKKTLFVKSDLDRISFSSVKSSITITLSGCQSDDHTGQSDDHIGLPDDHTEEECHSGKNAYFEQGDTFSVGHHHQIAYYENSISSGLTKDVSIDTRNLSCSIWRDIGLQTMTEKYIKKLNIFGEDWTLNGTFDATGGLLRGEVTSVELIIPHGLFDVFSTSEVYGSVYTKIGALRRKFDLSENEEIVGPGVEFWFPARPKFNKYAIVKIPYFGDDDINVYWFPSDSGSSEILTLQKLELKSKYNNANQDMYYQIGGDGFVYIYTKHFSGFLCTRCTCSKCLTTHRRELTLYGVTFGSYKSIDQRRQVRVRLYIADGKAKLDAFLQEYVSLESCQGREHVDTMEIGLVPDELKSGDTLSMRLEVMDDEGGQWIHKKMRSGQPLKPEVQFLQLSKIVRCCRQDDYPAFVEWFLENPNSGAKLTFQCFIDIDVTVTSCRDLNASDSTSSCSTIIIEGLRMQKGEEEELKRCEKVRGILSKLLDSKTANTFLQELGVDTSVTFAREKASHGYMENVLLLCQSKYDPGRFLAMTESIIRKLNLPRILEEIGSCYLHECVSGKAVHTSSSSSQRELVEAEGEYLATESYVCAELSRAYPSSTGPGHIPLEPTQNLTAKKHDTVRAVVHPTNHISLDHKGSVTEEEDTYVLKLQLT